MRRHATDPLFAWARLQDHPPLSTRRRLLEVLPDQDLRDGLARARGQGRDDFPMPVLGGTVVFTVARRHPTCASCLAELGRHAALYRRLGLSSVEDIPHDGNVSRFVEVLGPEPHLTELRKVFDVLAQQLGAAVADRGQQLAGDCTGLHARAQQNPPAVAQEVAPGLPPPAGGRKEDTDDSGAVVQVVAWFGYKLHLLVDVQHELPLAYHLSDTKAGDNELIEALLVQAQGHRPADRRLETLAYDQAADDETVHQLLHAEGIKPLLHNRALGREELQRPWPGPPGR